MLRCPSSGTRLRTRGGPSVRLAELWRRLVRQSGMSANPDRADRRRAAGGGGRGDPEAFVLYDQHAPWLLVRLRQRTASSDLADQIAQETFLVWRDCRPLPRPGRGRRLDRTGSPSGACWTPSEATPPRGG